MGKSKRKTKRKKSKRKGPSLIERINWLKVAIFWAITLFVMAALWGFGYYLLNSSYFEISELELIGGELDIGHGDLEELYSGRNIFLTDIGQVKGDIERAHPRVKRAQIRRALPDKLRIELTVREPYAVIMYAGGIVIDKEGFVIDVGAAPPETIKVEGLSFFLRMPNVGEKVDSRNLERALLLLKTLRERLPEEVTLEHVRILRGDNMEISVDGVPVRMGSERYSERITRLARILSDPRIDLGGIRYIDLRFEDTVIAPK